MFRNFLLLAFRNFLKNSSYTIINVLGLSVGLASFILLSLFVKYEFSYDTFHDGYERIYRAEGAVHLANDYAIWTQVPAPVSTVLQERYPEVEEAITIREVWGEYLSTSKERTFHESEGYYANPDVFDLFKIKFISGNKQTALDAPMKIVLTESVAKKLFPKSEALGQSVLVDSKRTYIVSGVIEDMPFNTNIPLTYLIPFSTYTSVYKADFFNEWDWHDCRVFVKLKEGVGEEEFEQKIATLFDEFIHDREDKLLLNPIKMIHLVQGNNSGYLVAVMLYGIVGVFTLVLAALNFVNLTTANSLTRAKEIGVKKIVGSTKGILIRHFLGESIIIVVISLLIAFTLTEAALPVFNKIVSVPLEIKYISDWKFTLFIVAITFCTGILSGLYPAVILSSLSPIVTVKNQIFNGIKAKRFSMRKGLVIFQLVLSVLFILNTLGVKDQFNYLKNKDLGFDKTNLLRSYFKETEKVKVNDFEALRSELKQISGVVETSISINTPFYGSWGRSVDWEGCQDGEYMNSRYNSAYETYLETMDIKLMAGRNFDNNLASDSAACIVNKTFIDVIGWTPEEAIGKMVYDRKYTIIGVMKDFHEQSPYIKIMPYILINHSGDLTGGHHVIVRVNDISNKETKDQIKAVLEDYFPESNFSLNAYDNNLGSNISRVYEGMVKTFGFFSLISIVIAIVGLFALVSFSTKRKVKEIGIRKVLGAKPLQIYKKFVKEYIMLIVIANLISVPLSIMFYEGEPSYYKAALDYSDFVIIGIISILVTVLTISIQVIKSSRANPVDSLRYE